MKDRCPDNADSARIERYEQCAANEILHVSNYKVIISNYKVIIDPVCNRQLENW